MIELSVQQGTPEWKASRKNTRNASDYPSAQGLSKKFSRADLVKEAATGIEREFSPYVEEKIFPDGHRIEALARPIAEQIIGEELFPIVATSNDGYLGASSDGATMLLDTGWECKQWNIELAEAVSSTGSVPETHVGQLDQQGLVFGFERILFMVTDGTPEKCVHCWHTPTDEAKSKIRPTWKQFDEDVANYQHVEAKPEVVPSPTKDLPAIVYRLNGLSLTSNIDAYKEAATKLVEDSNKKLVTDQDFADRDYLNKRFAEAEKTIDIVSAQAIGEIKDVDKFCRDLSEIKGLIRQARINGENAVKTEKENRKSAIVNEASQQLGAHVIALQERVGVQFKPEIASFADAIKGLKSLDSMRDKVSVALANAKIEANAVADRIEFNQKQMQAQSAAVLFHDFIQVCTKAPDDFAALVAMRVAAKKEADEKLLAEQREKIRAEEEARALASAATQAEQVKQMAPRVMDAIDTAAQSGSVSETTASALRESVASIVTDAVIDSAKTPGKTIKLGEICGLLGFTVTADFLSTLGFDAVAHNKNAKLYYESSFKGICAGISAHVLNIGSKPMKEAA